MHLANADGATQTEIAEALEVEQPSIVGLIDALEKKGLIERRVVEGDRRSRAIFLTEAARDEANEILAFACTLRRQVLNGVDEKDLKIATRVLQQVTRNICSVG
jgi:MarR family transcriptional regulator for hemolysin